jgi:hypothetical protein
MSKFNQIQNELNSLGDAAFQKLADLYLHKKGYEQINPIGSVIGSDKVRKGTPDTLITLSNGKYIFAEYTTQKLAYLQNSKEISINVLTSKRLVYQLAKLKRWFSVTLLCLAPTRRSPFVRNVESVG